MYNCRICNARHRASSSALGEAHYEFSKLCDFALENIENVDVIKLIDIYSESLYFTKYIKEIPDHLLDFMKRICILKDNFIDLIEKEKNNPNNKDVKIDELYSFLVLDYATDEDINKIYKHIYNWEPLITAKEENEIIIIEYGYLEDYDFIINLKPNYEMKFLNNNKNNIELPTIISINGNLILSNYKTKEKKIIYKFTIENFQNINNFDEYFLKIDETIEKI